MGFRALLVCLWLASAATARASDATTPTTGPTHGLTTEICADDATWYHLNRSPDFDCAWVAQKPDTRCSVNGVTSSESEVVVARDACAAACSEECNGWYASNRLRTAVALWFSDRAAAEKEHGHISTWDTSGVTDMSYLFKGASSFNEDISAWDTSDVTSMYWMFFSASAFNQDISDWVVDGVKHMEAMFDGALAFDQDLGWCARLEVWLGSAFRNTLCESTSCGVAGGIYGDCVPSPAPTPPEPGTDAALRGERVAVALLVGGVLAFLA